MTVFYINTDIPKNEKNRNWIIYHNNRYLLESRNQSLY